MNQALKVTARLLEDQNYRSVAELIKKENKIKEDRFKENKLGVKLPKRNKAGDYKNTFYRQKLKEELENILKTQQEKGNSKISDQFIRKIVDDFFWYQRPALSGEAILKMLGHCLHEPDEYRAAKHSYSAERFVWLSSLNNLRISEKGEIRKLTEQERLVLIDLPYSQEKITYKTIRKFLKKEVDFPAGSRFIGLNGKTDEELAAAEKKIFFHGRGYHELRKAFSEQRWEEIIVNTALLDQLATILTLYKTDEDIEQHLRLRELNEDEISNLLKVSFSAFNNLSLKALTNLLSYLKQGENYYEACQHCGYSNRKNLPKQRYLPPLYRYEFDKISNKTKRIPEIKNLVVMRALNQARKVLNALIRRYDSPNEIHIELARDLPKSAEERNKIDKQHEANRKLKELLIEEIRLQIGRQPKSIELLKYRLYKEQDGKCAYSIKEIDIRRLFETGYVEVDHILPYSRSYDDSLNNKVLVLSKQNQNKHNQTPYEYLNGAADSENWRTFVAMVQANPKFSRGKKERLLRKNFNTTAASEFAERNLNDTRYIARYFTQFIRDHLQLNAASDPQQANNNIIPLTGGITSFLRAKWGLIKTENKVIYIMHWMLVLSLWLHMR